MPETACRCRGHGCVECLAAHPPGRTCNDCAHGPRCAGLGIISGAETHCDWIPSRFQPAREVAHA
jgi:hypothetical protein